jgi:hypothetical protein
MYAERDERRGEEEDGREEYMDACRCNDIN